MHIEKDVRTPCKAKLAAPNLGAVLVIVLLSAASVHGLREGAYRVDELGGNRLPSIDSLLEMHETGS